MPQVTIKFNLPEERSEFNDAKNGTEWRLILYEVSMFLRNKLKYGHEYKTADEALEAAKEFLWSECRDSNLDPWSE